MPFPKGISAKVNIIMHLKFKHTDHKVLQPQHYEYSDIFAELFLTEITQSAGAVEDTDCISVEG